MIIIIIIDYCDASQSKSQLKTVLILPRNCGQMVDFCALSDKSGGQMFFVFVFV